MSNTDQPSENDDGYNYEPYDNEWDWLDHMDMIEYPGETDESG